jgi:hypothetical protein
VGRGVQGVGVASRLQLDCHAGGQCLHRHLARRKVAHAVLSLVVTVAYACGHHSLGNRALSTISSGPVLQAAGLAPLCWWCSLPSDDKSCAPGGCSVITNVSRRFIHLQQHHPY